MKIQLTAALLFVTLTFSGCYGRTSPENVVKTAGYALSKSNLKDFRATLTGRALKKYGNQAGMASLQTRLTSEARILGVRETSRRSDGLSDLVTYEVAVGPNGHTALVAAVSCLSEMKKVWDPSPRCPTYPNSPPCLPDWKNEYVTDCRITDAR